MGSKDKGFDLLGRVLTKDLGHDAEYIPSPIGGKNGGLIHHQLESNRGMTQGDTRHHVNDVTTFDIIIS